jgi:hypothetical protein
MFQYLITYIQHQSFSIQHEFSLIPVNLEQNLTVLQKKKNFKQPMFQARAQLLHPSQLLIAGLHMI